MMNSELPVSVDQTRGSLEESWKAVERTDEPLKIHVNVPIE